MVAHLLQLIEVIEFISLLLRSYSVYDYWIIKFLHGKNLKWAPLSENFEFLTGKVTQSPKT